VVDAQRQRRGLTLGEGFSGGPGPFVADLLEILWLASVAPPRAWWRSPFIF
jgi:hypothetical protein